MGRTLDTAERPVAIHPTAVVDEGAAIGAGTQIWHFSHVMTGAVLGRDCRVGQNVFVGKQVRIGDRVKIQNNVSLFTGVTLEDDVFCGPSAVFTNVKEPRSAFPKDPVAGYRYVFFPMNSKGTQHIGTCSSIASGSTAKRRSELASSTSTSRSGRATSAR